MCTYVLISHSLPLPNPTGLNVGIAGNVFGGIALGKYLGEFWLKQIFNY